MMIRNALLQMALFDSAKETENKLRWDAWVDADNTKFSLYIPKWRVPEPWPAKIWVDVSPRRCEGSDPPNLRPQDTAADVATRLEPIVVTAHFSSERTRTVVYTPVGEEPEREIGVPYVPTSLTFGKAPVLRLIVLWDITSRGMFGTSPIAAT